MTFIEIEKLCSNVIEDDKINKEECNNKKSDIYLIYNDLCKTEAL